LAELTYDHDGLTFDVSEWGPGGGDVVILLHGFPANRSSWRGVAPSLGAAGYRVLAPDQRGYSPGARPPRRRDYAQAKLVGDVLALADVVGARRFHVVGHDWGGAIAWALGGRFPERLATLSVLSTPHPQAMAAAMIRSSQLLRSWYVAAFQLPFVPEAVVGLGGGARFRKMLVDSGLSEEHAAEYAEVMASGAARYAINWYRAIPLTDPRGARAITTPTLYVYSTGDVALTRAAADRTGDHVTGSYRYEVIEGASHWLPEEQAHDVSRLLLDHLGAHPV